MLHHKERLFNEGNKSFLLKHNLRGNTVEEWVKQFKENETYRKIKRPDSVILSHEIISFAPQDAKNISLEKLEAIAKEYIQLRNPNAIYIAVPHTDKEHFHLHLCVSGIEYHTGKSLRMAKTEFTELKKNIQEFQKSNFPELENSIVEHGKNERKKDLALPDCRKACSDTEYQIKKSGRATDKEKIISLLESCYHKANSKKEFFEEIKKCGMRIYSRSGKITGVWFRNMKFRFARLGFEEGRLEELNVAQERRKELNVSRKKSQEKIISRNR